MKKNILVLEPDRTVAKCIKDELTDRGYNVTTTASATDAIETADKINPDSVVTEISLAGHSGTEFLYEFRTYSDWLDVPVFIYSSMKIPKKISDSHDWQELNVTEVLYKPDRTLSDLADAIELNLT